MGHFLPFDPPNYTKDQNFEKLKKNAQRYYHFTLVYHKQRSYDISFLRHQARQTNFFVILGYFLFFNSPPPTKQKIKYLKKCALLPPSTPSPFQQPKKMKILKKWKKSWRCHHFTQVHQKSWPYDTLFLKYNTWQM